MATVYYGTSGQRQGLRIHMGSDVSYFAHNDKKFRVRARCGIEMIETDIDAPQPKQVTEFCKNCFRKLAWEMLQQRLNYNSGQQDYYAILQQLNAVEYKAIAS